MCISARERTLIGIKRDLEALDVHERHLLEKIERIDARIGLKSSVLGDRIQGSIEPDAKIVQYIGDKAEAAEELREVIEEKNALLREKWEIEKILKESDGEEHKVAYLYYVKGMNGYDISYRVPYSKSQVYRIIDRFKRWDKKG